VLRETRDALLEWDESGLGVIEFSHRSAMFDQIIGSARERLTRLLQLGPDQELLFLQGGASSQFFMVPMNLLRGRRAAYVDTGRWSKRAAGQAERYGDVDVVFSGADTRYDRVPRQGGWGAVADGAAYFHYTSNNTVAGTRFDYTPQVDVPLVCDASSDILSAPWDCSKIDLLYAGAQKNMGPSGVTLVVVRRDMVEECDPDVPDMLSYRVHVKNRSLFNTPNTFGIFVIERVAAWIEDLGGLEAMADRNRRQAGRIYDAVDGLPRYRGIADPGSRSLMNITFTTGDPELDTVFWQSAAKRGLTGLKGHSSVGGLRASVYNAQTDEAVSDLVSYMADFARTNS
jgi:phosphoserine aminotransferase